MKIPVKCDKWWWI